KRLGLSRVQAAAKGRDSVMHGIAAIQEYRIVVHRACWNTATELGAYCWKVDKTGKSLNEPVDRDNHLMDALRYAMEDAANFRPTEEKPKPPRRSQTAVTGSDLMNGGGL
ncbi:MAG: terminase large subunit, partial [Clostridia bacterium]|nr:terminase large subunit [Clostridia bacterium]